MSVIRGEDAILTCQATGFPEPTVTWRRARPGERANQGGKGGTGEGGKGEEEEEENRWSGKGMKGKERSQKRQVVTEMGLRKGRRGFRRGKSRSSER